MLMAGQAIWFFPVQKRVLEIILGSDFSLHNPFTLEIFLDFSIFFDICATPNPRLLCRKSNGPFQDKLHKITKNANLKEKAM